MRISEENIDLFEAYLSDSLSEKEVLEFEARLSYDSDFREQFENYRQIESGIKQHYRNQIKSKFNELDEKLDNRNINKTQSLKWWVISGAAAIIIMLISIVYLNQCNASFEEDNLTLAKEYWPYDEGLPVKMSVKGKFDNAMNAFKLENWEQAELLLLKIDSDTSDYFLGIINYQQKEYQQSKSYFKKVTNGSIYFHEAQFRLALVSILTNDIGSSKVVLRKLIEKDNEYNEQAKKLLSELE